MKTLYLFRTFGPSQRRLYVYLPWKESESYWIKIKLSNVLHWWTTAIIMFDCLIAVTNAWATSYPLNVIRKIFAGASISCHQTPNMDWMSPNECLIGSKDCNSYTIGSTYIQMTGSVATSVSKLVHAGSLYRVLSLRRSFNHRNSVINRNHISRLASSRHQN